MAGKIWSQSTVSLSPGAGLFPNLPVGYTVFNDQPWDVTPNHNTSTSSVGWFDDASDNPPRITKITDATAPASPSNVAQGKFPIGMSGGVAPFRVYYPFANPSERYPKLYVGYYLWLSSNFAAVTSDTGFKHTWIAGDAIQGSQVYTELNGDNLAFYFKQQGTVPDRTIDANVGLASNAYMTQFRNTWGSVEYLLGMNTADGTANGTLKVWINNILTHDYSDINWITSGASRTWKSFEWYPIGPAAAMPADEYQNMDHIKIAGSN